jgi:hypothetical protein
MHNAPPVVFPVGRFVWGRVVWWAMTCLGAVGLAVWQMLGKVSWPTVFGAWFFWGLCVVVAALWGPRQGLTDGRLFWSGEAWFWQAEDGHGSVEGADQGLALSVGLDWGRGLLLFVRPLNGLGQGCGPWAYAWLAESDMPSRWHGLRCAVYSRPKTGQPADGLGV